MKENKKHKKHKKHNKPKLHNSSLRWELKKRLLIILGCAIPIFLLADAKPPLNYLVLVLFLTGMYQLIVLVKLSPLLVDEYFPPKLPYEVKPSNFNNLVYYLAMAIFFLGIISQLFEIRNLDNTIDGFSLFWLGGLLGLIIAFILTVILRKTNPSVFYESKRRFSVYGGFFLGFFLIVPATLSFINHHYASEELQCYSITIQSKGKSSSTRRNRTPEYYIFAKADGVNEERFTIPKKLHDQLTEGGEVELCVLEGKLGYQIVTEFRVPIERPALPRD